MEYLAGIILGASLLLSQETPRELIQKLRSESVEDREAAVQALKRMGPAARSELEKAAQDADPEMSRRSKFLLRRLAILEHLTPAILGALPGLEDRLAGSPDRAWVDVLYEVSEIHVEGTLIQIKRENPKFRELREKDLEALAGPAAKAAASPEDRRKVCRVVFMRKVRVPATDLLSYFKDPEAQSGACHALYSVRHEGLKSLLPPLLGDNDPSVRKCAVELLARHGIREAIPAIAGRCADPDPDVRRATIEALRKLRAVERTPDLRRLLSDGDRSVRLESLAALQEFKDRESVGIVMKLLKDPDTDLREAALVALRVLGSRETIPSILPLLGDGEWKVRCAALSALGYLEARECTAEIVKALHDPEPSVRAYAIGALADMKAREAVPHVLRMLSDKSDDVCESAVYGVEHLEAREAIPLLVPILKHGSWSLRCSAVRALGGLRAREVSADVLRLLGDVNADVRRATAYELPKLGGADLLPGVLKFLKDEQAEVRETTLRALVVLGARGSAPDILRLLDDDSIDVREGALWSLGEIGIKEAAPRIVAQLDNPDARVRRAALYALELLDALDAAPAVARLLKDKVAWVRIPAAKWICRRGGREGVPLLLEDSEEPPALGTLNALREPERWKKLREARFSGTAATPWKEALQTVGMQSGLKIDWPAFEFEEDEKWLIRPVGGLESQSLSAILEQIPESSGYEAWVEPDRIRILPGEQARAAWRAWWATKQ